MAGRLKTAAFLILCALSASSIAESTNATHLQFRPEIGSTRTMRVTWRLVSHYQTSEHQDRMEYMRAWTVDLQPVALDTNGNATLRVGIRRIQEGSVMFAAGQTNPMLQFDSAENRHQYNESLAKFAAFLHETFTVKLSGQGRVLEMNTDDFFARVAENRLLYEDQAIRFRAEQARAAEELLSRIRRTPENGTTIPPREREDPEDIIKKRNDKYGSPRKRQEAYRQDAPTYHLYGTAALDRLMSYLMTPLATEPIRPGDRWTAPAMIYIEGPLEMAATHTLQDAGDTRCTIQAEAYRTLDDGPVTDETGRVWKAVSLKGTYVATMVVDRATGWQLHRNAVMDLTGTVPLPGPLSDQPRPDIPVNIEATVTVEPVADPVLP